MNATSLLRSAPVVLILALMVTACSSAAAPSASPAAPSSASPSAAESSSPPASASSAATGSPAASPAASTAACPDFLLKDVNVDDRLVGVAVTPGSGVDRIRFTLAASSATPAGGPSTVEVSPSAGPFVADPSGQALAVAGSRFIVLVFRGMTLFDATGTPSYAGPTSFTNPGPGVRAVVRQSAYEGVTSWIVGYEAAACPSVDHSASAITVVVVHD